MKISVYNQKGETDSEINIAEDIFGVEWNPDLVHQVFVAQRANSRQRAGHAKGRSEVRGGGRKPWRQKGTGRARHGSIRSPIWVGGGVTFGPNKDRKPAKDINKKMKIKALFSLLSKKHEEEELFVVDSFNFDNYKTKAAREFLDNILEDEKINTLIIATDENKEIKKAIGNIKNVDAISAKSLNVSDLLSYKFLVVEKDALETIANHYSFKSKEAVASK